MERSATHDDARLILQLYDLRREKRMRQARSWFAAKFTAASLEELDQLCPSGSDENAYFRMVVTYWDMAASFVTAGVLNADLFFKSGRELLLVWIRVSDLLPAIRERMGNPLFLGDLEEVAQAQKAWLEEQSPDAFASFEKRIKGMTSR